MGTAAEMEIFGKDLNISTDGHPETIIPEIIRPIKNEVEKKMEKHNLSRNDALTLVLEDYAPAYDPYGTSILNRGPKMGPCDFKYKATKEKVTVTIKHKDKKIAMDWEEIEKLDRKEIRNKYN